MIQKLIASTIAITFLAGCSFNASPVPGLDIGVEAKPDAVGVEFDVNPWAIGCEFGKVTSWNFLENKLCPEVPIPDTVVVEPSADEILSGEGSN